MDSSNGLALALDPPKELIALALECSYRLDIMTNMATMAITRERPTIILAYILQHLECPTTLYWLFQTTNAEDQGCLREIELS